MGKEFGRDLEAGVLPGGDAFAALQGVPLRETGAGLRYLPASISAA